MKRGRFLLALALLVSALAFGAFESQEALAVAPCSFYCDDVSKCWNKCACETPEWGIKVTFCSQCPWFPNPCTL